MDNFDELISKGELTKAARLFAKEYYDSGRMGNTRRLLIERLADKCDKYDAAIARQTGTEKAICPNCGGSGVYHEYDEYDRYTVHHCATCDGSGEITHQSIKSEEVESAIEQLKYAREQDREFDNGTFVESLDLAITALQAYQPWIPCSERLPMEEPDGRHSASKMVLVYAYNGYSDRFASTDITVDGKWYNYPEPEFEVTHWKPLPEPPKGE